MTGSGMVEAELYRIDHPERCPLGDPMYPQSQRMDKEFYATGRQNAAVLIEATEYENGTIVAVAEGDHITNAQLRLALAREYPHHTFNVRREDGYVYAEG